MKGDLDGKMGENKYHKGKYSCTEEEEEKPRCANYGIRGIRKSKIH